MIKTAVARHKDSGALNFGTSSENQNDVEPWGPDLTRRERNQKNHWTP